MKEKLKQLAKQAEFCFWGDEPYNPGDVIDWACRYDDELSKLYELMIDEFQACIEESVKDCTKTTFDAAYLPRVQAVLKDKLKARFE